MIEHASVIELSKSALKRNLKFLRKRIGGRTRLVSVVKGNAYGHGIRTYLPLAEDCGVHYFSVSDAFEAERANEVKKKETELMIMGYVPDEAIEWCIENEISYFVFESDRLEKTLKAAEKIKKQAKIHIELETGMNRTGFCDYQLHDVVQKLNDNKDKLFIEGVCTHYAGAESVANYLRVTKQIKTFNQMLSSFYEKKVVPKYRHTACSAAALTYPQTIMDLVRFGIAQYGFWPSPETKMHNLLKDSSQFIHDPLQRVISWKTKIMSIKHVKAGEFVGYGNHYLANKDETIALVPIGYGHGYARALSNIGHALIHGKKAQVIGIVNMNLTMMNVTHIQGVKPGDEVVLIGKQGKQTISVGSFAEMSKHINYEMLTRIPADIPRVVVD